MGASTHSATPTGARPRRVTDLPTRLYHALLGLSFAGAYLSADSERWRSLHITLGYTMAALLVFRLLYGLFGPRPLRWSSMASRLRGVGPWLRAWSTPSRLNAAHWRQGQNLLMLLTVAGLLACIAPLVLSGHASWNEWGGEGMTDVLEEVHEALGEGLLVLVGLHLALLAVLGLSRGTPAVTPMLTGRVPGPGPDLVTSQRIGLALLMMAAAASGWIWAAWPGLPTF
ncbi:cytochrome b/b6 domain-containing protein [Hydrogenophaga sp. IBVHS2]|uniref:cytochrome b/b6 domain-containing protein n=1 Tax=Hydrogenophaga sp. IBVHS2 TaxID=1985170 RepID=UPI0015C51421|nr:cytochrome b/b6 domain-containing protein [Hydrogenophaga sp. IBVHS2]